MIYPHFYDQVWPQEERNIEMLDLILSGHVRRMPDSSNKIILFEESAVPRTWPSLM